MTLNAVPCNGFVIMSAYITSIGQLITFISPLLTFSLMKKNFAFMCFVLFPLDMELFLMRNCELILS
jgi:hypothetical protein